MPKTEVKEKLKRFFENINSKEANDVRKIKRAVMGQNIALGKNRRLFCKKCLAPYRNPKVRIKKGIKSTTCERCGYVSRWRIK